MPVEPIADLRRNVGEQERLSHGLLGLLGISSGDHMASVCRGASMQRESASPLTLTPSSLSSLGPPSAQPRKQQRTITTLEIIQQMGPKPLWHIRILPKYALTPRSTALQVVLREVLGRPCGNAEASVVGRGVG